MVSVRPMDVHIHIHEHAPPRPPPPQRASVRLVEEETGEPYYEYDLPARVQTGDDLLIDIPVTFRDGGFFIKVELS